MPEPTPALTIVGDLTKHRGVKAPDVYPQSWLDDLPVCAILAEYDIIHLGVVTAVVPYRFVRPTMVSTIFLACLRGEGRVFNDGRWSKFGPGSALLLQTHTRAEYRAEGAVPWELVWVCYQRKDQRTSIATVSSPGLVAYDPQPIFHAVEGLRAECTGANDPV